MSGKTIEPGRQRADRRVARTRAALHDAFKSLLLRRRYEAITIKEICDEADVARSTFYAHYASKDDLKRDGLERLRMRLLHEAEREGTRRFAFSLAMFEHAREHLRLYRALVRSRGGAIALRKIREILEELVRKDLAAEGSGPSDPPRELVVHYVVGAYMSLLTWWLDEGAKLSPEQLDAAFRRLVAKGIPTDV